MKKLKLIKNERNKRQEGKTMKTNINLSVNFHITEKCNMKCKYCFAKYSERISDTTSISLYKYQNIIKQIKENGFSKISFAGGEPLLHFLLPDLIKYAKSLNLTTMLITNGFLLNKSFIERVENVLDWVSISIDSLNEKTNLKIGRAVQGKALSEEIYCEKIKLIHSSKINLKINTVVSSLNYRENFSNFINNVRPKRWKIFQVLPIKGINQQESNKFFISKSNFEFFINNNKNESINMVTEHSEEMIDSYVMIDPLGRLYGNSNHEMSYSSPIYEYGLQKALEENGFSIDKFLKRGGDYNW